MHPPGNPLLALHNRSGAELQAYDQLEIVSTFGVPQAEYAAIRKSAALMDLPQRGILELTGKDRHGFLNNLISNEVFNKTAKTPLPAGRWVSAFLLNLKGRVVLDMNVIELGDRTLIEMDVRLVDMLAKLLDRYLFADQVKLTPQTGELHEIALHGPRVWEILEKELAHLPIVTDGSQPSSTTPPDGGALTPPREFLAAGACAAVKLIGFDVVLWRDDVCGVPGVHLIVPTQHAEAIWQHLLQRYGAEIELGKRLLRQIGWAAFNAVRIEAGRPLFGIDFELAEPSVPGAKTQAIDTNEEKPGAEKTARPIGVLPAETGLLDRAVSFTKGCYLGQEVVARMHARSQVARKLVGLRVEDGALPFAGEHVYDEQQNQIGVITSSTMSPVLSDAAIALALVRKPHFEPGKTLLVPAEGAMRKAAVTPLPFVAREPKGQP